MPTGTGDRTRTGRLRAVSSVSARSGVAWPSPNRKPGLEQLGLDGDVALCRPPRRFHQGCEVAELGQLICGANELEEHLRGDLDVGACPVAVGWLPDGEMRQEGVEFVVRQARD